MKKVITCVALVVAVAGVFVAKANDKKRAFVVTTAYYGTNQIFSISSGSAALTTSVTSGKEAYFQKGTGSLLQLTDASGGGNNLYTTF